MALRIEAFLAFGLTLAAQPFEFTAKQERLWRDEPATVHIDESGVQAGELKLVFDDVQQLTLSDDTLRVLGYKDSKWRGGRDREWTFEHLPKGVAAQLYPFLAARLDARFVAALAVSAEAPLWEIPAKLHSGLGGSEGVLVVTPQLVIYRSPERDQSRTWRIRLDIEQVSSSGPHDLVMTTQERRGVLRGGPTDFRFQLKRPLKEAQYEALWRRIQQTKGVPVP